MQNGEYNRAQIFLQKGKAIDPSDPIILRNLRKTEVIRRRVRQHVCRGERLPSCSAALSAQLSGDSSSDERPIKDCCVTAQRSDVRAQSRRLTREVE